MDLRTALFVEASETAPSARDLDSVRRIWNALLAPALGLRAFAPVVGISKKHLVAMDPRNPPMSGAAEPLDALMARTLKRATFDAAVVAWDLIPAWNPGGFYCRWDETLDFYRMLSGSAHLPSEFKARAAARVAELDARTAPSARPGPPEPCKGEVLALCMEPMFEGLLVENEAAVRRALGVERRRIRGWPARGWGDSGERHPDQALLAPAVLALTLHRPRLPVARRVHGDFRTNKHGWGAALLEGLLVEERGRAQILAHPIAVRLAEIGPRAPARASRRPHRSTSTSGSA
jgi:hypothetical protein